MSSWGNAGGSGPQPREPRNGGGSWGRQQRPRNEWGDHGGRGQGGRDYGRVHVDVDDGHGRRGEFGGRPGGDGKRWSGDGRWDEPNRTYGDGLNKKSSYHHQREGNGNKVIAGPPRDRDGAHPLNCDRDAPIPKKKKGRYSDNGRGGGSFGTDRGDWGRPDSVRGGDGAASRSGGGGGLGYDDRQRNSVRRSGEGNVGWGQTASFCAGGGSRGGGPTYGRAGPFDGTDQEGGGGYRGAGGGQERPQQKQNLRPEDRGTAQQEKGQSVKKEEDDVEMVDFASSGPKGVDRDRNGGGHGHGEGQEDNGRNDFDSLPWRDKLLSQYRFEPAVDLPEEAFNEDGDAWAARKVESAERAIKAVVDRMHGEAVADMECEEDEEESDYEDDYYTSGGRDRPEDLYPYSKLQVQKFFRAVPWALLMTIGFNVSGLQPSHEENCHCPCGADMVKWRNQFGLEGSIAGKDVKREFCTKGKMTPVGFMGHLRTEGDKRGGLLHFGLRIYMEHLYGKTDGSYRANLGHKAMYFMNDANWRKAEAAANRAKAKELKRVEQLLAEEKLRTQRLEEERRKDQEQIAFVNHVNEDLGKQIRLLKDEKEALHIESRKEATVISEEMLKMWREQMKMFFRMGAVASQWAFGEEAKLEIKVDQNFSLKKFLDVNYRGYEKLQKSKSPKDRVSMDATLLFSDLKGAKALKNYHGNKILSAWNVIFQNEFKYGRRKHQRKQKEDDTAIDEGGPTREFLSQFFDQIGDVYFEIEVEVRNKKKPVKVELFEKVNNGFVPQTDSWLENKLRNSPGLYVKAQAIYRALGRVMLHAIATGHTISSSVMPPFYKNWVFRNCSPKDDDYDKEDVLIHLNEEDPSFQLSNFLGQRFDHEHSELIIDQENIFTHFLPQQFLDSRKKALNSIKDGLTLSGDVQVQDFFRAVPFKAFQKLVFSLPFVSAEAIKCILKPKFCVGWEGSDEERRELRKKQEEFFGMLCELLEYKEENEPEFLAKFVSFCTGFNYLPDPEGNPDFAIEVEFNFAETFVGDYPRSHSCVKLLKLPGHIYSNRDEFEQKLDEAVISSYGRFDMN